MVYYPGNCRLCNDKLLFHKSENLKAIVGSCVNSFIILIALMKYSIVIKGIYIDNKRKGKKPRVRNLNI